METATRFAQAFLLLSVGTTLARLSTDTGGGDYFFTLIWLVLVGTVAPYLTGFAAARRVSAKWGLAIVTATAIYGAMDASVRMQAFFFPTERSGGGMALWLPISAVGLIPLFGVIAHLVIGAAAREP